jgi:hypothetical protein
VKLTRLATGGAPRWPVRNDRQILLVLILVSSFLFFAGLLGASVLFYSSRKFVWTDAIISDLQSPEENPKGYLIASSATAICGLFLFPLIRVFHRRLRQFSRSGTATGSFIFGLGALGAVSIGCLAPFPISYESVHVPLAFATFIGIVAGIVVYLFLIARAVFQTNRRSGYLLSACLTLKLAALGALVYIYFIPDFFTGESWLTTLALWEWMLCLGIVSYLLLLVIALDKHHSKISVSL